MFELQSPNSQITVRPGNIVKLNRFDDECWVVNLGWFSYAGNRPINGWYLVSTSHKDKVKPLNLSDLDDIYVVEIGEVKEDYKELDPKIKKLIHDLKVQVEDLQAQVAQLTVEIEAKDKVIEEKGQEILILQKQINDLAAEITALESQHNLDVETIETLNSQVRAQAEIIAEKAAEIRRLTARVEELAAENELLTQQHQQDLETIAQQSATIQEQAQSIADLTAENETLTDENDRLTDENESLVAQHQQDVSTIETQGETITQQGEQITELSGEVSTLQGTVAEQQATITRQNTTIDQLNSRVPALQQLDPINPSDIQQTYNPESPNIGFPQVIVNPPTAEGVGFNKDYYKEGETCLGKVGTYNPFPEQSYGGMYITEKTEDGFPVKLRIINWNSDLADTTTEFSFDALIRQVTLRANIKELIFENCKNISILSFSQCPALEKLILSGVQRTHDSGAFQTNPHLKYVDLGKECYYIGYNAFAYDAEIETLIIPGVITEIHQFGCAVPSPKLKNVVLGQGFNGDKFNLSYSTLYSVETIVSWLEALADRTGETAYTLTIGTTNINKLTTEERAIAINKNWNLA